MNRPTKAGCKTSERSSALPGNPDGGGVDACDRDNGGPNGGGVLSLLDGATSHKPLIDPELEAQREIARDASKSTQDRLEAYENIIDSAVGDTILLRARNTEREVGLRQIYLKFEGGNPSGTQKDRIAFAQAMDAMRRGFDTVTLATCGNYGAAMAIAASIAGLRCIIYIPRTYHTKRIKEMEQYGAQIVRVEGDYEAAVTLSSAVADAEGYYDANPGGENSVLQIKAYGEIAFEIYDELRDAPAAVAVPVSNGTTLAGIYKGFLSLYRRGKTSRMPRIVAASSFRKNPIIEAYLSNSPSCCDLKPEKVRETPMNEPLVNWHSADGNLALDAVRVTNGWASHASDKNMLAFQRLIRDCEGLNVLPASTVGLIALLDRLKKEQLPGDRYVVVLTGRK
ncbi:MAG: pyridoxal-phosphate dependent enzyme [Candidatus Methanosuratincola sp.]